MNIEKETKMNSLHRSTSHVGEDFQDGRVSPRHNDTWKKGERSQTGCLTCRARKIKCDQREGGCKNCDRVGEMCSGYDPRPLKQSDRAQLQSKNSRKMTEAGIKRRRLFRSCKPCQKSKTKCSGSSPPCSRCLDRNLSCIYEIKRREGVLTQMPVKSAEKKQAAASELQITCMVQEEEIPVSTERRGSAKGPANDPSLHIAQRPLTASSSNDSTSWLVSSSLPNQEKLRKLVESYFNNVHPLRCYGFVHKPSFMESLDASSPGDLFDNVLFHAICALGAKFYALEYLGGHDFKHVHQAGSGWAAKAQSLLFNNISKVSIESLMASVLLHDYQLRVGNYMAAFIMSGMAARMVQALQINVELSTDILCSSTNPQVDSTTRECRRRLMWSCFIMDSWVGSGVDQLTMLDERDIKVQLPSNEQNFLRQVPSVTETMANGRVLPLVAAEDVPADIATKMGLNAYFIRISALRKRVLRFIKETDATRSPEKGESRFAAFNAEFEQWLVSLPPTLQLTPQAIYIRKESNQLAALFLLHCVYHVSICDLYRVGNPLLLPSLMRHHFPVQSPGKHRMFLDRCRQICFNHAKEVAGILDMATQHGPKMLSDTWLSTVAYESTRIIVYRVTCETETATNFRENTLREISPLINANLKALRLMIPFFAIAKNCYQAALKLLRQVGLGCYLNEGTRTADELDVCTRIEDPAIRDANCDATPESVLNPLAIYSLARRDLSEKHIPEGEAPPKSSIASTSGFCSSQPQIPSTIAQSTGVPDQQFSQPLAFTVPPRGQPLQELPISLSTSGPWVASGMQMDFELNNPGFTPYYSGLWQPLEALEDGVGLQGSPP